mmetsp:Transcript_116991/g.207109  ORF Transcript_116991/g.207109 Transcript_116991/m.207109 type:complete len:222 (-) Transcript_116991:20-685(-)
MWLADALCALLVVALAVMVPYGMWSSTQPVKLPIATWFPWHPVLMTCAFPCLMTAGRWAYVADAGNFADKQSRRVVHRAFMGTGAIVMIAGYVCIFMAHLPAKSFFGFDFKKGEWKASARVVHSLLGYAVIAVVLAQGVIGAYKMKALKAGMRMYTFHGTLGKVIIFLAYSNVLVAAWFWPWTAGVKLAIVLLVLLSGVMGVLWPKPEEVADEEIESMIRR